MKTVTNLLIVGLISVGSILTAGCGKQGSHLLEVAATNARETCQQCKKGAAGTACEQGAAAAMSVGQEVLLNNLAIKRTGTISYTSIDASNQVLVAELQNRVDAICEEKAPKNLNDCRDGAVNFVSELRAICASGQCRISSTNDMAPHGSKF